MRFKRPRSRDTFNVSVWVLGYMVYGTIIAPILLRLFSSHGTSAQGQTFLEEGPPQLQHDPSSAPDFDSIERCNFWKEHFHVVPGLSWGRLPLRLQREWEARECDDFLFVPTTRCRFETTVKAGGNALPLIAILAGVSTRGLTWNSPRDLALFRFLLPSIVRTVECGFRYIVVLGYDLGDAFYDSDAGRHFLTAWFNKNIAKRLRNVGMQCHLHLVTVNNTIQKPGPVFIEIAKGAFDAGADYMYRVNDDSEFLHPWAKKFVQTLQDLGWPYGVVGPSCNESNTAILNHDFTHRTHMEIFNHTYYPPELTDWYMDDWISRTYGNKRTRQVRSVELRHHTTSQTVRYYVDFYRKEYLEGLVREGRDQIAEYMRAHNETSAAVKAFLSSRFDNATVAQVE